MIRSLGVRSAARRLSSLLLLAALTDAGGVLADDRPETRLMRFPDVHGDFVVFSYAGDIWRAPLAGGDARRLTAHPGLELFPKISPDGRSVAFTAEYTGSRQVFVMQSEGGRPRQLTFYSDVGPMPPRGGWDYWIQDWTPDGKILVRMNRTPWGPRMGRYYLVDPAGGLESPLPLPEGGSASIAPDGKRIAYCPVSREFRTWKRYRGGRAQDVWIYDRDSNRSERLTEFPGTDSFPMWVGDTIYFVSDRSQKLNLFAVDVGSRELRQVTRLETEDVLWPSAGPRSIVFTTESGLHRLDLVTEELSRIPVLVRGDLPHTVPHFRDVRAFVRAAGLSPSGARAVLEARGEIFSVPAKHGPTRNLTRTQGVREISPAWSPDGTRIAYLSDDTGEYEIHVMSQDGSREPRRLTEGGRVWRFSPRWSPDSSRIAFADKERRLLVLEVESSKITEVDRGVQGDLDYYRWSPDGRWLVYEKYHDTRLPGIALYSVENRETAVLGDGLTSDYNPVFSADGRHLFFLSDRDYPIRFSAFEFNYLYTDATRVYAVALDPSAPPLFPPRSDEEGEETSDGPGSRERGKERERRKDAPPGRARPEALRVERAGFVDRTIALPGVEPGRYAAPSATEDAVFYLRFEEQETASLRRYDLEDREEETVADGVLSYALSADGEKALLGLPKNRWAIVDAERDADKDEGALDLSGLRVKIDPVAEWHQMFDDAWRIVRDWFYDPGMHGKDWDAIRERYGSLVPFVAHRNELDFIFGEMIAELEAGHTYVSSGDEPEEERVTGGMLGCEFESHPSGYYRIARIFAGENWTTDFRSPLTEPGVAVKEGDLLLAVDGEEIRHPDNPYRPLEGKADRPVVLTVSDRPSFEGAREVTVRPVASEINLRYLDWVRGRMRRADELSGGRIGYIHLPNTAVAGNRMLQKLFYGQTDRDALVIDCRYNGGGFIPDRMIEYLSRTTLSYWARRGVESMRTPGFAHDGPKAMLINGYSSSGGDALPYYFRKRGLGLLVGTRTWGGLIGLTGNPPLVDGGSVLVPTFRIYDEDGRWVVENEGVSPDVEVIDLPEERIAGRDPSLDRAVELLLRQLDERPARRPTAPAPPRGP